MALLLDAGEQLDALGFLHPQFAPWRALAAPLADELGDRELALRLDSELMEFSLRTGAPTALAQALRIHGCLHGDLAALSRSAQAAAETPRPARVRPLADRARLRLRPPAETASRPARPCRGAGQRP